jgi:hypothetical protein
MKLIKLMSIGLVALAITGLQFNLNAQEGAAPEAKEKAPKKEKVLPFNGTLKALNTDAGTVTVGNRTFKLTMDTKYLQGGLDKAKIGEKVGGSYIKADDGTLIVNSIRFGPKPPKEKKEKKSTEE